MGFVIFIAFSLEPYILLAHGVGKKLEKKIDKSIMLSHSRYIVDKVE